MTDRPGTAIRHDGYDGHNVTIPELGNPVGTIRPHRRTGAWTVIVYGVNRGDYARLADAKRTARMYADNGADEHLARIGLAR